MHRTVPNALTQSLRLPCSGIVALVAVLFLSTGFAPNSVAEAQSATSLSDYRWRHRVLIILSEGIGSADSCGDSFSEVDSAIAFDADQSDPQVKQLKRQAAAIDERDLVWVWMCGRNYSSNVDAEMAPALLEELREAGRGESGVTLIGKDGGVKYRASDLDLQQLFDTIDSMPMRAREMREREDRGEGESET